MNDNIIANISDLISGKKEELTELESKKEDIQASLDNILNQEAQQEQVVDNVLEVKEIYHLLIDKIILRDVNDIDIYLNI